MHRRAFLAGSAVAALVSSPAKQVRASASRAVRATVNVERKLGAIPADFIGLGYEISSVAVAGLLSGGNRSYVQLLRTLSPAGVIRIGGNTSDDSMFSADGKAVSAPKGTVVNKAALKELGTFLDATGWRLIWGLNLGSTDERQAVAEAEAVAAATKAHLLAFEIGNEPDLFGRGTRHRPESYRYETFLQEFRRYKNAIRARVPDAQFAGPDVADATAWVGRFAADEGGDLKLLTHHYYRECAGPSSSLEKLLHPDPKLAPQLAQLKAASSVANVPYRICETNSFCGGGKQGVSDTFGAALWVLEFLFSLASAGCSGVNIETGVNQLGFVSWYSPVAQDEAGAFVARPEYYGMLAFARATGRGELVQIDCDAAGVNVSAYAVASAEQSLWTTIINKDVSLEAEVTLSIPPELRGAEVLRLTAPSLESKQGVSFGGSAVSAGGKWTPRSVESLQSEDGRSVFRVPGGSAAVLKWSK